MVVVWSGKVYGSSGFEKIVAIKLLHKDKVHQEIYHRALTDEALLQVQLKHPNIVDVYDLNIAGENPYLVMEYVEGIELWDLLRRLTKPLAIYIVYEISKALSYAHGRASPETGRPLQIVHRDVSPSNILLSKEGEVKLSDFGIAKSILQTQVTQVGQIKGKFRYMSPEQARGEPLDYRSDIFSLGLVFYECLFGQKAYRGDTDTEILRQAQEGQLVYPEGMAPALKKIFERLCASQPGNRYTDLADFRQDLKEWAATGEGMATAEELKPFLAELSSESLQNSIAAKHQAQAWKPQASSEILDQSGRIQTLAISMQPPRRRRWQPWALVSIGLLAVPAYFLAQKFSLQPQPIPEEVPVSIAVPERSEKKLPLNLTAHFNAVPYAEVSIPGQFTRLETPIQKKSLPLAKYRVTFYHPPTGRRVQTALNGVQGGSFSCTADMAVADHEKNPSATCRRR